MSLQAPEPQSPRAFLRRALSRLKQETGFRHVRTLGYRAGSTGPILVVLGEVPMEGLSDLRRIPFVAELSPAPQPGLRDAVRSADTGSAARWAGQLPSAGSAGSYALAALLFAFPWIALLLHLAAGV